MYFFRADILYALDWLLAWILDQTGRQVDNLSAQGCASFDIRNNTQTFYAASLAKIYAEVLFFFFIICI